MSHSIQEPKNFSEVAILSADVQKAYLKANLKYIKTLIINQTFISGLQIEDRSNDIMYGCLKGKDPI